MYKLNRTNSVKRLSDGAYIQFANGNRDYEEYKQWLSEGNTPEPEFCEEEIVAQELAKKIQEAKDFLNRTDRKFFNGYKPKDGEDLVALELQRDEARDFIRANKVI